MNYLQPDFLLYLFEAKVLLYKQNFCVRYTDIIFLEMEAAKKLEEEGYKKAPRWRFLLAREES